MAGIATTLSKQDVARAHLEAAIDLHFREADAAAVYHLAVAAFDILGRVGDAKNISTFRSRYYTAMRGETPELWRLHSNLQNFLKHAERDPDAIYSGFDPIYAEGVLWMAGRDYMTLFPDPSAHLVVFDWWFLAGPGGPNANGRAMLDSRGGPLAVIAGMKAQPDLLKQILKA